MGLIDKIFNREVDIEKLEKNRDVEKLLNLLKKDLKTTNDLEIQVKAAKSLSRIGDQRAIVPMNELLNKIKEKAQYYFTRAGIARSLDSWGSDPSEQVAHLYLINARNEIINALGALEKSSNKIDSRESMLKMEPEKEWTLPLMFNDDLK